MLRVGHLKLQANIINVRVDSDGRFGQERVEIEGESIHVQKEPMCNPQYPRRACFPFPPTPPLLDLATSGVPPLLMASSTPEAAHPQGPKGSGKLWTNPE